MWIFSCIEKTKVTKKFNCSYNNFYLHGSHIIAMIKHQNKHAYIDDTLYKHVLYM